jgi:hypothetical protein
MSSCQIAIHTLLLFASQFVSLGNISAADPRELPAQVKPLEGILVPVPKEIFRSLDKFQNANWRAVQRPEIVRWKSHGDQVQIALLLGVTVAEGFVAMEGEDSAEVHALGNSVLTLARGLGVEETALRRSRSIMDYADQQQWARARREWDGVLSDLENGMIALKSEPLSQLVSLSGWLRGTEAICALVLENYSQERAEIVRQPALLEHLEEQLAAMPPAIHNRAMVMKMRDGIRQLRALVQNENKVLSEKTLKQIRSICHDLVTASSQRPT